MIRAIQTDLFATAAPRHPRARTTDPCSSHQAASDLERSGRDAAQAREVLAGLEQFPGCTSAELAARYRLDRYAVARRLPELEAEGRVRRRDPHAETVPCEISGRRVVRWWPV